MASARLNECSWPHTCQVLNGEMSELFWGEPKPLNDWVLLWDWISFVPIDLH